MVLNRSLSLNVLLYFILEFILECKKTWLYLEGGLCFPQHPALHLSLSNQCMALSQHCFSIPVLFVSLSPVLFMSYLCIPIRCSCTVQIRDSTEFLHVLGSRHWRVQINCIAVNYCWLAVWCFLISW